jgi:TRAP-type C4-dicarboxylate transport system permease small subunit
VESIAAVLVLVEIGVLFAGVVARYGLHHPLVWSDELASILFLWLSMLGAVVALRRGEHMRMTALVARLSPSKRMLAETLAIAASLAFLALVLHPAWEYASEEAAIVTPALEISNAWRATALPTGLLLMGIVALLRLLRAGGAREVLLAVAGVALLVGLFWLAGPLLKDAGKLNETLEADLKAKGMQFNRPAADSFRAALRESGFYADWKKRFGDEAWGLLEAAVGKLV